MKDERVFIAIGSNMGERESNCLRAVDKLSSTDSIELVARSSLYLTAPWGMTEQRDFVNAVVEIRSSLPPSVLMERLREIECSMGRRPSVKWGERVIDLDIIYYGERVLEEPGLKIPHPRMRERGFVLVPLEEIAPDFKHPVSGQTTRELTSLAEDSPIRRL